METPQQKRAYTVAESAVALGVSQWLVRELCRTGRLRCVRLGNRIVIPCGALDELLTGSDDHPDTAAS